MRVQISSGAVKLVDFGLAVRVPNGARRFTVCGSTEYMAPEVRHSTVHVAKYMAPEVRHTTVLYTTVTAVTAVTLRPSSGH